jgi:hypothetical protein
MAIGNYLPSNDKERVVWFRNFISKFNQYAPGFNFSPIEVAGICNDCAMFTFLVDAVSVLKHESNKRISYKNLVAFGEADTQIINVPSLSPMPSAPTTVPAGIFRRLSMTIRKIKNHPAYTESIGSALGILGEEQNFDACRMKPELKGAYDANRPLIRWKKGCSDSIDLFVDRNDGAGFRFLANDTQQDYIDTYELRGKELAVWNYKGIYKIGDETVGSISETISITVDKRISVMI